MTAGPRGSTFRSLVIDRLLTKNSQLNRSELENLPDDALVKHAKREDPELSYLTVDLLKREFGTLSARSSAPYSQGSSDAAMLASGR
jgi:hypothetical protein